jgi:hypothetical protein
MNPTELAGTWSAGLVCRVPGAAEKCLAQAEGLVFRFLLWAILAALKPKALLVAENLCLQQQLLVLQRRQPRPYLKTVDRFFWVVAS